MTRASKSINLVLIGSALLLSGCGRPRPTCDDDQDENCPKVTSSSSSGNRGYYHSGGYYRYGSYGGYRSGGSAAPGGKSGAVSPRGGFGAAGHAAGGS